MKNLFRIPFAMLVASLILVGCSKDDGNIQNANPKNMNIENSVNSISSGVDEIFESSVAIISRGVELIEDDDYVFYLELKDFSNSIEFENRYSINNLVYTDDGHYLDEVAGDGIYTSIKAYKVLNPDETPDVFNDILVNTSESFEYMDDLQIHLNETNYENVPLGGPTVSIKFGCKVRTVTCPETNWWNECWFGSPCTCVEFYDCEASIEAEVEIGLKA